MRTIHIFNAVAATSDKYSMALTVAEAAGIRKGLVAVAASAASSQVCQRYILRIATGGTVALVGPRGPKWKLGQVQAATKMANYAFEDWTRLWATGGRS
ncbi:hypothetical protein DYB37_001505 [Aphanomyces astaci]|uniref:Uncharacterized protein n=1 Tax=Aphanomyces astaci TaxID=112090 RepID=A0A397FF95_APHAT|nr:hypothetical protein DYB30_003108 [Aphanomyces astaci]RHY82024.1 hypothetical protein DYB26_008450 [Aphanomyces astaci]RHY93065.1 hypothetical protein DYB35_006323 [Aphanomyces astaci]RHZ25125.1 hypothetical protein DYB37_001505 [Aphanomyces astaci]RHZ30578.1 hypothetical protein DYB31_010980 [Aphanomyces astaci]